MLPPPIDLPVTSRVNSATPESVAGMGRRKRLRYYAEIVGSTGTSTRGRIAL